LAIASGKRRDLLVEVAMGQGKRGRRGRGDQREAEEMEPRTGERRGNQSPGFRGKVTFKLQEQRLSVHHSSDQSSNE
jgi:hypothetical protein